MSDAQQTKRSDSSGQLDFEFEFILSTSQVESFLL